MARQRVQKYLDAASMLRCPLCGGSMHAADPSISCPKGHSFNISSKGFITFVGNCSPLKGYDAAFFEARSRIFGTGLYEPVLDSVVELIARHAPSGAIVDAGCGEGYYAKGMCEALERTVVGLDYSKDAIMRAARGHSAPLWLVADLANIPIANGTACCIANIFTPANYGEFKRVLHPDGVLVKVVPGANHMQELRQLAKHQLRHVDYSNRKIIEHLGRHAEIIARKRILHTQEMPGELTEAILKMSPVSFDLDRNDIDAAALHKVTVDAEVLVARLA